MDINSNDGISFLPSTYMTNVNEKSLQLGSTGCDVSDLQKDLTQESEAKTQSFGNSDSLNLSTILQNGSSGQTVSELQSALKQLGFSIYDINGYFGDDTQKAVIAFQKSRGISSDGIVQNTTKDELSKALIEKNSPLSQFSCAAVSHSIKTSSNSYGSRLLKYGTSGDDVKNLQADLKTLGYLKDVVDGIFGSNTQNAVKAFQRVHGLDDDGIVGDKTKSELVNSMNTYYHSHPEQTASPSPAPSPSPASPSNSNNTSETDRYGSGLLNYGTSGDDVKNLQADLKTLGYLKDVVDGIFGKNTQDAVLAFQRAHGLDVDGIVGNQTKNELVSSMNSYNKSHPGQTSAAPANPAIVGIDRYGDGLLLYGSTGDAVRNLQTDLKTLGYLKDVVDGIFGENTLNAVKKFQTANGLQVDGVVGNQTKNQLVQSMNNYYYNPSANSNVSKNSDATVGTSTNTIPTGLTTKYEETLYSYTSNNIKLTVTSGLEDSIKGNISNVSIAGNSTDASISKSATIPINLYGTPINIGFKDNGTAIINSIKGSLDTIGKITGITPKFELGPLEVTSDGKCTYKSSFTFESAAIQGTLKSSEKSYIKIATEISFTKDDINNITNQGKNIGNELCANITAALGSGALALPIAEGITVGVGAIADVLGGGLTATGELSPIGVGLLVLGTGIIFGAMNYDKSSSSKSMSNLPKGFSASSPFEQLNKTYLSASTTILSNYLSASISLENSGLTASATLARGTYSASTAIYAAASYNNQKQSILSNYLNASTALSSGYLAASTSLTSYSDTGNISASTAITGASSTISASFTPKTTTSTASSTPINNVSASMTPITSASTAISANLSAKSATATISPAATSAINKYLFASTTLTSNVATISTIYKAV